MLGMSRLRSTVLALALWILPTQGNAKPTPLTGDLTVHDPVLTREGAIWYVFSTVGKYVGIKTSADLRHWTDAGSVFAEIPAWARQAVPGTEGIWAPDIAYVNGEYRLYYSVSTFGSNRSAIGLATSPTLDPKSKAYRWTDRGMVVQSTPQDDFNAIDPNFVADGQGRQWLALGSFWSGIKLFALDPKTGKPAPGTEPLTLAYLIASYDYCCKGVNSTYYTVIGRADRITGPYKGRDGSSMLQGGGTILLRADLQEKQRYRGPGHAGAFTDADGTTWLVWHAYDREANGAPKLRVGKLRWDETGWPVAEPID